jgi:putative ABC transport system ATP-binding protein
MQRVAIARALVHQPRLLLADEPTGNLDPDTAAEILQLIRNEIRSSKASAILVTHSPAAAASADRILLLTRTGLKEISADEAHAR